MYCVLPPPLPPLFRTHFKYSSLTVTAKTGVALKTFLFKLIWLRTYGKEEKEEEMFLHTRPMLCFLRWVVKKEGRKCII